MKRKIIVAPLNWGLGHASRCVPIINALISNNFIPIIASDGHSLSFLQQEFPQLESLELPAYQISYGKNLKLKLVLQFPKLYKTFKKENRLINDFVKNNKEVVGIISDNRFGVFNHAIPSVYITHQVNVLSGFSTFLTSFMHQKIIKKFDECWIPDNSESEFSGKLSTTNKNSNLKYIGVLSRFKKQTLKKEIDLLVLVSGPEPNRSFLEDKLKAVFKNDNRTIVFVLGNVEQHQKKWKENNTTFYNYVLSNQLEKLINTSEIVVCRSGYSSIMDLAILHKKAFFIPTKHQSEQEYLAKYLASKKMAPFSNLNDFKKEKLKELENYIGLKANENQLDTDLFSLFECKRKL
ncbi:glycosyltransferase [Polaribacter sp.]|uniref:glycosyltransferase n=1 Tax=Polaribacter sp. TaxID=1920175 RepID=UPI003F6CD7D2